MDYFKKIIKDELVLAILLIVIGLVLLIFPIQSLNIASLIIAGLVSVGCLANLIYFFIDKGPKVKIDTIYFVLSLIGLIIGIYTFINPLWLITALNIIVGLVLLVSSVNNLRYLLKYTTKSTFWWIFMVINVIIIVLGIIALINPLKIASIITRLEGISLILAGVMSLLITKKFKLALV